MDNKQSIVITGGNRGIGYGLLKKFSDKHNVIITVRDNKKGESTIAELGHSKNEISYVVMDVNNPDSVIGGADDIKQRFSSIDLLINNAGILKNEYELPAIETSEESILKTFNTNTLGVLRVCKSIVPLMSNGGRIINISSGMGQLDAMESGSTAYRISKTALNVLTKILSNELSPLGIKVNTICPGWVKTDMGGENATLTIEESTTQIVNFALKDDFPNGQFLRHGEIIPW
jgi:NAD(P)-dependent dehydrogenase (short-subunit alcohol dehydrogenase family)|tara:strand:- start:205 stop:900 length:696 start_codon:yes stop_codon:yes gene_type:complete